MTGQLPPSCTDAEEALLAAILLDADVFDDVAEVLTWEDFYSRKNGAIFRAMSYLSGRKQPIDLVTVVETLGKSTVSTWATASDVAGLVDSCPVSVNAQHHAQMIRNAAIRRRMIVDAHDLIRKAYDPSVEVGDLIADGGKMVDAANDRQASQKMERVGDLLDGRFEALEERAKSGTDIIGIASGFKPLDQMTGGFRVGVSLLAARPKMGKTALAEQIAKNVAKNGKIVAIFSMEMVKSDLVDRFMIQASQIDEYIFRTGKLDPEQRGRLSAASGRLFELPIFLDDSPRQGIQQLRTKCRRLKKDVGLDFIIVDYLQLMKVEKARSRNDEVGGISGDLDALSKEFGAPVLALSQLNRKVDDRGDKRPIPSDLRDSGSLEQDAQAVIFIYRPEVYKPDDPSLRGWGELLLSLNRHGNTGDFVMKWTGKWFRFDSMYEEV